MIFDLDSKSAVPLELPDLDAPLHEESLSTEFSSDRVKLYHMGGTLSPVRVIDVSSLESTAMKSMRSVEIEESLSPSREQSATLSPSRDQSALLSPSRLTSMSETNSINSGAEARRANNRLRVAKSQARLREFRLRVPTVSSSVTMAAFALLLRVFFKSTSPMYALQGILSDLSSYCCLLGLLPTDKRGVSLFAGVVVIPVLCGYGLVQASAVRKNSQSLQDGSCAEFDGDDNFPCWIICVMMIGRSIESIVLLVNAAGVSRALCLKTSSEKLLTSLLFRMGFLFLTLSFNSTIWGMLFLVPGHIRQSCVNLARAIGHAVVGYLFLFAPEFRKRVQSWFMSRGRTVVTAAGIAELLGGRDIDGILNSARKTFLFVRADLVLREAMEKNCPDPNLVGLTQKGHLGHVDAFVSHSWHDDASTKWEGLQDLLVAFKKKHSREPKLWIDKYCINQNEISESLACLPVYLSGCSQLWILCGKTYLDRLWCIMEILIFLEMGGQIDNLHVRLLGVDVEIDPTLSLTSIEEFRNSLKDFDPSHARCSSERDTELLQAVLEATGDQRIKDLVRDIFK